MWFRKWWEGGGGGGWWKGRRSDDERTCVWTGFKCVHNSFHSNNKIVATKRTNGRRREKKRSAENEHFTTFHGKCVNNNNKKFTYTVCRGPAASNEQKKRKRECGWREHGVFLLWLIYKRLVVIFVMQARFYLNSFHGIWTWLEWVSFFLFFGRFFFFYILRRAGDRRFDVLMCPDRLWAPPLMDFYNEIL